jgi:hypothetical protein
VSTPYGGPPAEAAASPAILIRVSWSAILAGIVLALAIEILLDVLGAGVGLELVKAGRGATPNASSFGTSAGIWWLASTIIALVIGCYVAARLAGVTSRWDGVLHGLVIWAGMVLIAVYLLTSAIGDLTGGAFSMLRGTVSAAGSAAATAVRTTLPGAKPANSFNADVLQQQAEDILNAPTSRDAARMSRADATKAIAEALPDVLSGGEKSVAAKKRITDIVSAQARISSRDAQKRVDDVEVRLNDLKNQATETTGQTARASAATASRASLLAFAALLIGAIASAVGGWLASPEPRRVVRVGEVG